MKHHIIGLWKGLIIALLLILTLIGGLSVTAAPAAATYYLTPGDSIQTALERAQPGDTLVLSPGTYAQDIVSVRAGLPGAPITITGPRSAVLNGLDNGRMVEINHGHIVLDGFTINGARGSARSDKLIYVLNRQAGTPLLGLKITNMAIGNAGGECVRLRYLVQQAEIAGNTIGPCGLDDFPNGRWAGDGKNGEGVYIGTAPEQLTDGKNPDSRPDQSNNNWVHHNTFNTQGNECVDIKEDASGNLVEHNDCTGQRDTESAGFDSRGSGNTFRLNSSYNNLGAGVRLGGDDQDDGQANEVYGNVFYGNAGGGIRIQRDNQRLICGNTGAQGSMTSGSYGSRYNAGAPCPASVPVTTPVASQPTAAPSATASPVATASAPTATASPAATTAPSATASPVATAPAAPAPTGTAMPGVAPIEVRPASRAVVQAELAALAPPWETVTNGERMGGAYIRNTGPGGIKPVESVVTYEIDKRNGSGTCRFEVLGRGDDDDANSVRVRIDDQPWVDVHAKVDSWRWTNAEQTLKIANGRHRLQIGNREYGTAIDAWSLYCP